MNQFLKTFFVLIFIISAGIVKAQGKLEFEEKTHDFGEVSEENGPIKYQFTFINTGDQPVKITNVKASCGCTTPDWTKDLVMPGSSGFITAQYNPLNRPGQFKKSLQVASNAENGNEILFIEGYVKPQKKTIEDELPNKIGNIRIKYKSLNLGKVTNEKVFTKSFDIFNDGTEILGLLNERTISPAHVSISLSPEKLEPKKEGTLLVSYDPVTMGSLGFHSDNVRFYTSDAPNEMKEIYVVATTEEYFPPMTPEQIANAPKLVIDKSSYDFGRIAAGTQVETTFQITNNGKSDLKIRETRPNCGCTVSKLDSDIIKPGESVSMSVSFNGSGRKGRQFKTVTIFSNDPIAPTQMVSIRAEIAP